MWRKSDIAALCTYLLAIWSGTPNGTWPLTSELIAALDDQDGDICRLPSFGHLPELRQLLADWKAVANGFRRSPIVPSLKYVEVRNLSSSQTFSNSILFNKSTWMPLSGDRFGRSASRQRASLRLAIDMLMTGHDGHY